MAKKKAAKKPVKKLVVKKKKPQPVTINVTSLGDLTDKLGSLANQTTAKENHAKVVKIAQTLGNVLLTDVAPAGSYCEDAQRWCSAFFMALGVRSPYTPTIPRDKPRKPVPRHLYPLLQIFRYSCFSRDSSNDCPKFDLDGILSRTTIEELRKLMHQLPPGDNPDRVVSMMDLNPDNDLLLEQGSIRLDCSLEQSYLIKGVATEQELLKNTRVALVDDAGKVVLMLGHAGCVVNSGTEFPDHDHLSEMVSNFPIDETFESENL